MSKTTTKKAPRTDWKKKYEAMEASFKLASEACTFNSNQCEGLKLELKLANYKISDIVKDSEKKDTELDTAKEHIKNLVNATDQYKARIDSLLNLIYKTICDPSMETVNRAANFVNRDAFPSFKAKFQGDVKEFANQYKDCLKDWKEIKSEEKL